MSIFPANKAPASTVKLTSSYEIEKERQFKLQVEQMKQLHEMRLAQQATETAEKMAQANHFPSNAELINRIMDMQKRYIERLEADNVRLSKELARATSTESGKETLST